MPMISPALALASHRRGARTGAGAAAARTRRDNSRDIDSMLAPAAGDCDRVSQALRLALFGALVWLCADREQPFVATRAGECRRRRSHGRQQAAACGWGLTFRSFLCRDVERLLYVEATRSGCSPIGGVTCVADGRISTTSPPAAHPRQTHAGDDSLAPALVSGVWGERGGGAPGAKMQNQNAKS